MAPEEDFDGGSDLSSELSEPLSGPASPDRPMTPGEPPTPRTTPPYMGAEAGPTAESSTSLNEQTRPRIRSERRSSLRNRSNHQLPQRQRSSDAFATSGPAHDARPDETQFLKKGKAKAGNYEYTSEPHRNVFREVEVVQGKRTRTQRMLFGANGETPSASMKRQNSGASTSRDCDDAESKPSSAPKRAKKEATNGAAAPQTNQTSKANSQLKVKITVRRNSSTRNAHADHERSNIAEAEQAHGAGRNDERDQEEEEDEVIRGKKRPSIVTDRASNVDARSLEDVRTMSNKKRARLRSSRVKEREQKRRRKSGQPNKRHSTRDKLDDEDGLDEEYAEEDASEDELMTDDADEDREPEAVRKKETRKQSKEDMPAKSPKDQKSKSAIVPAKDYAKSTSSASTSGGGGDHTSSPSSRPSIATQSTAPLTPARPPAKSIIRKSTGSSVLANLMGYGGGASGSRDNTPSRNVTPRPRPPVQAVRPNGNIGAAAIARLPSGTSSQPSSHHKRTSEANGGTTATAENPGLTGKHVTAEQIAMLHDEEVYAHANPTGLFDLLHGAELMMEFEDETRQRLEVDPFLHKHKLYRPGRTEGMWRLVERIKANEGRA